LELVNKYPEKEKKMTLQLVLAIAGSIALLVGLFGGGVKAKEIEVPKINVWPRILSSLVGIILIGIAIRLPNPSSSPEPLTSTPIPPIEPSSTQGQINFVPSVPTNTLTDTQTATQIPTVLPTDTPTPTLKPAPQIIPFGSSSDPNLLNTVFGWQPGNSPTNAYDLASSPNGLTLTANGHTDQWAELDSQPVISYPLEGNFETQVKLVFNPMWGHELAALGVRSAQDHHTWLRLGSVYAVFSQGSGPEQHIVLDIDGQGKGNKIKTSPYAENTVYLKIERRGSVFDFYYSSDGDNWTALQTGYIADMPANVEVFLTVGSWGDGGTSAKFYDFKVLKK